MTAYILTYQGPPEMLACAKVLWAKPKRDRAQRLRETGYLVATWIIAGALIVIIIERDIVSSGTLLGVVFGCACTVLFWFLVHKIQSVRIMQLSQGIHARNRAITATFCDRCIAMASALRTGRMKWPCVDDVIAMADGTILRIGGVVHAVSDAALPDGVSPRAFRDHLNIWREAAR